MMLEQEKVPAAEGQQFFTVSLKKIAVVSFFTFGWYWLYCFYRSWASHRKYSGERVLPLVRAFFDVFFIYALLKRVDKKLRFSGRKYQWSPLALTLGLIATGALPFFLTHGLFTKNLYAIVCLQLLLAVLNAWFVMRVQRAINCAEGDISGAVNSTFTVANWLWMSLGLLFWPSMVFLILSSLLMGTDLGSVQVGR
ncbi:hypothetical protein [Pseudomonas sp. MN1F]|uniref:hypothetical protein n=1 Tax=Pseudomonas sp. MN1F TaxID=1366632 RepID=UPI00128F8F9D|nr:hypothetical protein [Pseudomonas sp. MN1F]MQG92563.1 hypothetical protein [Pseudomonas sp. MN1F]